MANPNAILGMRSTADYANNIVQWNWADAVLPYDLFGELPLTALMTRATTVNISSYRDHWLDQSYDDKTVTLGAGQGASTAGTAQNLTLTGNSFAAPATTMLFNPATQERLRVTADPTVPTTLAITRGFGLVAGAAVAAIPNGTQLIIIGTASEEGSTPPTPVNRNPYELKNFTQIFKTPYTITGTDKATDHRGGDPWGNMVANGALDHMKSIENAMFFGIASNGVGAGGKPLHTMGGLDQFIVTNRDDFGGVGTLAQLQDFTAEVAKYGNRQIYTICGDQFITRANELVRGETNYVLQAPTKLFGYDVSTLVFPNAVTLKMITHPLLNGYTYYRNSAWMLHLPDIHRTVLTGRDTTVVPDILANGTDGEGEQLLTEMSIRVRREKNMGILIGL